MEMLEVFYELARLIITFRGSVSFEWPAYCTGWQISGIEAFFSTFNFEEAICHGCAFGLAHRGRPLKKPWKIMTTLRPLAQTLLNPQCICNKGDHGSCSMLQWRCHIAY
jgi:hypothetical protein